MTKALASVVIVTFVDGEFYGSTDAGGVGSYEGAGEGCGTIYETSSSGSESVISKFGR